MGQRARLKTNRTQVKGTAIKTSTKNSNSSSSNTKRKRRKRRNEKLGEKMNSLEIEEFSRRMSALTIEEQLIAVRCIRDEIMFKELERRSTKRREIIKLVENFMKTEKELR